MADGADRPERRIGEDLERLLDAMAGRGLHIGPRERIAAFALVAELQARGAVRAIEDLAPHLAPLIARSPSELLHFSQVFSAFGPSPHVGGRGTETTQGAPKSAMDRLAKAIAARWRISLGAIAACSLVTAVWLWPDRRQEAPASSSSITEVVGQVSPTLPEALAPLQQTTPRPLDTPSLERIARIATDFGGAPTLEELANRLAPESAIDWSAESYAKRLAEFSGMPRDWPIALYGVYRADARPIARLARAVEMIERPGRERGLAEHLAAFEGAEGASEILATRRDTPVYQALTQLSPAVDALRPDPGEPRFPAWLRDRRASLSNIDPLAAERALAIAVGPNGDQSFDQAAWNTPFRPKQTQRAPALVWLAAVLAPLVLGLSWALFDVAFRRAYLRRRPPDLPPLHADLVSDAASGAPFGGWGFQRIAQKLAVRTPAPTNQIDVLRTIRATLATGGERVEPVFAEVRRSPDYLVLIERRGSGDQDSDRLRAMVRRLEELINVDLYFYRAEPSLVEPERGGPSIPIERLQAQHPDHRLVILGSGAEFLDAVTLIPTTGARQLGHWRRRALLTPLPIAEWGKEEFELAHALDLPIGRATPEGFAALSDLLGLDGPGEIRRLDDRGDGRARGLPEVLRVQPWRFLYAAPPGDMTVAEILRHLRNYLDAPAFDWLCALAVYPAVQWDLTLYLGLSLPERAGDEAGASALFSEQRLAGLTQLPWLREGAMPNWLRRALIAQLGPQRSDEVRRALRRAIDAARFTGDARVDEALVFRIARESEKEPSAARDLFEDDVLLDFLARGQVEDLAIARPDWLDRLAPKRWLDRLLGVPQLLALAIAAGYAGVAAVVAPSPDHGALITGAWAPLWLLVLGAGFAYALIRQRAAYAVARAGVERLSSTGFAVSVLGLVTLIPGLNPPFTTIVALLTAPVAVVIGRRLAWSLGARLPAAKAPLPMQVLGVAVEAAAVALMVGFLLEPAGDFTSASGESRLIWSASLIGTGLATFAAGVLAGRFAPEKLPPPAPRPAGRRSGWLFGAAQFAAMAAPLPAALAVFAFVSAASVELESGAPGGAVIASTVEGDFFAIGGADGVIRVFAAEDPAAPRQRLITRGQGGVVSAALARVAGQGSDLVIAYALADGPIYRAILGADARAAAAPAPFAAMSPGGPPAIALGPEGAWAVAVQDNLGGARIETNSTAVDIPKGRPVAQIAGLSDRGFAVALFDGSLAYLPPGPASALTPASPNVRLPGRARFLFEDPKTGVVRAIGDDGTVLEATLTPEGLVQASLVREEPRLALGPAVAWTSRIEEAVPPSGELKAATASVRCRSGGQEDVASVEILSGLGYRFVGEPVSSSDGVFDSYGPIEKSTAPDGQERLSQSLSCRSPRQAFGPSGYANLTLSSAVEPLPVAETADPQCAALLDQLRRAEAAGARQLKEGPRALGDLATLRRRYDAVCGPPSSQLRQSTARDALALIVGDWWRLSGACVALYRFTLQDGRLRWETGPDVDGLKLYHEGLPKVLNVNHVEFDPREGNAFEVEENNLWLEFNGDFGARQCAFTRGFRPGMVFRDRIESGPTTQTPEMVVIPAGSFLMGSPEGQEWQTAPESPQRRVTISKPFAIGRYEVTFEEWDTCVSDGACVRKNDSGWGRGRRPASGISKLDAEAYAAWLSRKTGKRYRLPSEAEWEYAARAGTTTQFSFGDDPSRLIEFGWYGPNSGGQTQPVGEKRPNAFGLFDMHGNVTEIVADCRSSYEGAPTDGSANITANCESVILRGGAYGFSSPLVQRSAHRDSLGANVGDNPIVGFRVARDVEEPLSASEPITPPSTRAPEKGQTRGISPPASPRSSSGQRP